MAILDIELKQVMNHMHPFQHSAQKILFLTCNLSSIQKGIPLEECIDVIDNENLNWKTM